MFGEVGPDIGSRGRVRGVPYERLAQRLICLGAVGMALEELAALSPGLRVIGQDAAQRDLIARVVWILLDQRTQPFDGVGAAVLRCRLGLIVGESPVTGRRRAAEDLTVDR